MPEPTTEPRPFGSNFPPLAEERRAGADRRSTSAAGDRLRLRAATFHVLADANADMQQSAESDYMGGYGEGAANAYRAAAQMIEQLADEEDAR